MLNAINTLISDFKSSLSEWVDIEKLSLRFYPTKEDGSLGEEVCSEKWEEGLALVISIRVDLDKDKYRAAHPNCGDHALILAEQELSSSAKALFSNIAKLAAESRYPYIVDSVLPTMRLHEKKDWYIEISSPTRKA